MLLTACEKLYKPAVESMLELGITTVEEAVQFTTDELLQIDNVGRSTVRELYALARDTYAITHEDKYIIYATSGCGDLIAIVKSDPPRKYVLKPTHRDN